MLLIAPQCTNAEIYPGFREPKTIENFRTL